MSVITKISELLHYCGKKNNWKPDCDAKPILGFLKEAAKNPKTAGTWEPETAYNLVIILLRKYKEKANLGISDDLCNQFWSDFTAILIRNKKRHLIVLPLPCAEASEVINFGRHTIVPHYLTREEKIRILADRAGCSYKNALWFADHTEKSRSEDFYNATLLCIRMAYQVQHVRNMARRIAVWNVAFLRAMYYGYFLDLHKCREITFAPEIENYHIVILTKNPKNFDHVPLWSNSRCSFNLDWLQKNTYQRQLTNFNKIFFFSSRLDRLAFRFFRSFRLFSRSIDFLHDREEFEGLGLSTLLLMIAAEGVLLEREVEKRTRLASMLTRLGCPKGVSRSHAYKVFNECYKWRSDFVHSGQDHFLDYDEDLKPGTIQRSTNLLRKSVARLLLDSPKHLDLAKRRVLCKRERSKASAADAREQEWFNYLQESWERLLST
jgi:hypothetical protein